MVVCLNESGFLILSARKKGRIHKIDLNGLKFGGDVEKRLYN
jgi:hypothetical protein